MDRPILFSAPMVRAILEGRKTQTRRVVKPQPSGDIVKTARMAEGNPPLNGCYWEYGGPIIYSPYGQTGDRLWVRETWQGPLIDEELEEEFSQSPDYFKKPAFCAYRATDTLDAINADGEELGWRPSIHMPRWACRIMLEITGVRVERLQDISEADAIAEGIEQVKARKPMWRDYSKPIDSAGGYGFFERPPARAPILSYKSLFESICGAGSWAANPWVWVVEFKRVEVTHAA